MHSAAALPCRTVLYRLNSAGLISLCFLHTTNNPTNLSKDNTRRCFEETSQNSPWAKKYSSVKLLLCISFFCFAWIFFLTKIFVRLFLKKALSNKILDQRKKCEFKLTILFACPWVWFFFCFFEFGKRNCLVLFCSACGLLQNINIV